MIFDVITGLFLSKLTILLIDAVAIYLAFIVYRDNKKGDSNRIYVVMTFLMLIWVNFAYLLHIIGETNYALSWIFLKIAWLATPLFFVSLYLLTMELIKKEEQYKILTRIILFFGVTSVIITSFTDKVIKGVDFIEISNNFYDARIIYGDWMYPFLGLITFIIIATLFPIFRENILQINKLRNYLSGIFIFYFANVVFNITLPIFFDVSRYYYFGDYSTIILLGYTSYGIMKYKLFNIKVVAAESLTFLIWLALASEIFTAESLKDKILEIIVLSLTVVFGILLIRSVKNEIKQREELEKLTKQLKTANAKLKKLDAAKSEFISIASHQLRTPLTVIKGYLSMIREGDFGKLGEKIKDPIEKIFESSQRLISLVANLLNISRIESGRLKFNFTEMQLEDMIESVMEELKNKADEKGLEFTFKRHKKPLPKIRIDEEKIRQVVANIIDNSIKYTDEGKVEVQLNQEDKNLYFCVKDTGAGIKRNDIGKLFQKFSRGTGKTKTTDGTGLGLFVARQMVEAHKGSIWVESKGEGHGSKFCFTLPIKNNLKSTV